MSQIAPATILFVDDDAINRRAMSWLFRDAGFRVLEAATGTEGLRLVQQRPDLVVLDVNLPDVNGFEVCRRIRADPATRSLSILQISAIYVDSNDRAQGLEQGADGYLVKPVEPRELLATVRALLRVRAAEEAARNAAQEWRTTFDAISDVVCLLNRDGTIRRCNRALTELVRRPFADLLEQPLARVLREGLGLDEAPLLALPGAGTVGRQAHELPLGARWFRASADPIFNEQGACTGSVHILTDVTGRKELEDQLRQGQKLDAIGRLAGGIAHDFNNVLTVILGNAGMLLASLPAGPDREVVRTIERAAWRAAELTRQLLGFSRQTLLWLQATDLNDPLTEVGRMIERTLPANVALEVHRAADLWTVLADPAQMAQVLLNLCVNALDAMPDGGRLTLGVSNCEVSEANARLNLEARPGSFACLRVRDTGSGIPEAVRPRIFDPFFTTKPPGQGTGLGLAMVHGIVKQHQGWVECQSELGAGTTFAIYLPRARPDAAESAIPATSAMPGGTETILVASDNDLLRALAAALLGQNGFHVVLAEDGPSAVQAVRVKRSIQLAFLDLAHGADDVVAQMREVDPHLRTLFAASQPYRERELIQAVRAALDAPRLQ